MNSSSKFRKPILVAFLTNSRNTLTEYKYYHTNLVLLYKFNSLSENIVYFNFQTKKAEDT